MNDAIANEILVFNLSGGIKVKKIDDKWAAGYASNVTPNVNFKSSGRQKYTALRLVQESKDFEIKDFQNDLMDIMNEEVQILDNVITESVEIFNDLITEINFGQIVSKIKKVAQKLLNRILDTIKNFYNNVIKKVIKKLQEYIKLGISKFLEYIGIEVDGDANLSVNF
jgi:small-conductance mechanosensitive channel